MRFAGAGEIKKQAPTLQDYPDTVDSGWYWAPWGTSDRLPTDIRCKLKNVPMAGAAIDRLVKMMYGNGLIYVKNEDFAAGGAMPKAFDPRVEAFLKRNRINLAWYIAQCWDYRYYAMTFSEIIMNNEGTEIVNLYHKSAEHCRFARQSDVDLKVKFIAYSPRFMEYSPNDAFISWIPLYRWYEPDVFFKQLRGRKFAWSSYLPTPGTFYYPDSPWIGLFKEKGWVDVSSNVPRIVASMQENQITLKYTITISREYFRLRDSNWDIYTHEQQMVEFAKKAAEIETYLAGADNVFKSLTYMVDEDPVTGKVSGLITITAVGDKMKVGTWVPDSATADAQIVQGLGLHPSQVGLAPEGGKMGAGSGSDQRESFNTAIGLNTMEQEIILEPLNFISDFNGWGVRFMVDHTSHTTLNQDKSGLNPSPNTPQLL